MIRALTDHLGVSAMLRRSRVKTENPFSRRPQASHFRAPAGAFPPSPSIAGAFCGCVREKTDFAVVRLPGVVFGWMELIFGYARRSEDGPGPVSYHGLGGSGGSHGQQRVWVVSVQGHATFRGCRTSFGKKNPQTQRIVFA